MDLKKKAIDLGKASGQYGAGVVGLGLGVLGMNMVPASVPPYVRGAAAMILAYLASVTLGKGETLEAKLAQAASIGLGSAGALDLLKNLTAGKTGFLATINSKLPNLSGFNAPGMAGLNGMVEDKLMSLSGSPTNNLIAA